MKKKKSRTSFPDLSLSLFFSTSDDSDDFK